MKKNETGIGNKTTTIKGVNKKGLKDLVARYKQKTLVGSLKKLQKTPGESLKKPLKGLTALKSTPAHVKPCDLLKQKFKIFALKEISQSPVKQAPKSPPAKVEEKGATKPSAASKFIKTPTKNTKVSAKDFTPGRPAMNKKGY